MPFFFPKMLQKNWFSFSPAFASSKRKQRTERLCDPAAPRALGVPAAGRPHPQVVERGLGRAAARGKGSRRRRLSCSCFCPCCCCCCCVCHCRICFNQRLWREALGHRRRLVEHQRRNSCCCCSCCCRCLRLLSLRCLLRQPRPLRRGGRVRRDRAGVLRGVPR